MNVAEMWPMKAVGRARTETLLGSLRFDKVRSLHLLCLVQTERVARATVEK